MSAEKQTIVVTGATGLQGGMVARHLLENDWYVRGLTRNPQSEKAQVLSALGVEVVQADMAKPETLVPAFEGAYGLFSVQNPVISGIEGEISQGKNVATIAKQSGVQHLVYGSAGTGQEGTGIPSWESKLVIEQHMKSLSLPLTILRPMAFMELMTEKKFFSPVSTWHVMPKLMGGERSIAWLCTDDLGAIVTRVFAEPERFLGKEFRLLSDVKSIEECRAIYREVTGKLPSRFPMPPWLFERLGFVGKDLSIMWRRLAEITIDLDTSPTFALYPNAQSVRAWLSKQLTAKGKTPA